jgi:hypothetical protein
MSGSPKRQSFDPATLTFVNAFEEVLSAHHALGATRRAVHAPNNNDQTLERSASNETRNLGCTDDSV